MARTLLAFLPPDGVFEPFLCVPPPPMLVFFAPNAGALFGVPYPALAAWIGRSRPFAGDDERRLLRSSPRTGLGGPVGV